MFIVESGPAGPPHQCHYQQDQPGDQGANGKSQEGPCHCFFKKLKNSFVFVGTDFLSSPDPLQQAVHSDGDSLDLRVHPLFRPRQPRARRVSFNDRVCSEDDRVHQPPPRLPHLLHLRLQGVNSGQGGSSSDCLIVSRAILFL